MENLFVITLFLMTAIVILIVISCRDYIRQECDKIYEAEKQNLITKTNNEQNAKITNHRRADKSSHNLSC